MPRLLVVVLVAVAASGCEDRYGTYITVDGDTENIGFDKVELYFGRAIDAMPSLPDGVQPQQVFERMVDQSDRAMVERASNGTLATETTFYLPYDDTNKKLGDYVLVLAYEGTQPVGIAEHKGFVVEPDVVWTLDLELEPYSPLQVRQWNECIAWTRDRDDNTVFVQSTFAVVSSSDRDCDGEPTMVDCDDTMSCAPGVSCGATQTCGSGETCALGCGGLDTCEPRLCLYPGFCEPHCQVASVEGRHDCGMKEPSIFTTINVNHLAPTMPCEPVIRFRPFGRACRNANLEYLVPNLFDMTTFNVSSSGDDLVIEYVAGSTVNTAYTSRKLAISCDPLTMPAPRWSFQVELAPVDMGDCAFSPQYMIEERGAPADCQ